MARQKQWEACPLDLRGYQKFWATVSPTLLQRYKGKSVAVQFTESGWQIIDGADDLEQLQGSLLASGVDLDTLILDRVPSDEEAEEESIGGVQLE